MGTTQRDWKNYEPGRFGDHLQEAAALMGRVDPRLFQDGDTPTSDTIHLAVAYCLADIADNLRTIVSQQQETRTKERMV